jgi:biopolymer transport protein ExbD
VLVRSTGERTHLAATGGEPDYRGLAAAMQKVRQELPGKDDITVRSSDEVVYDRLIRTLDLLRGEQFANVNVTDASQGG